MQIWGKPVERLRGNAKYAKPCSASLGLKELEHEPEVRHNIAHLDLFFIRGVCFILSVLDPMKYCWVEHLSNRNAESIRTSLERFLAEMKSRRVRISMMRCDNEGGVWVLESWLKEKGIMMDKVAPGAHCEIAERKIQQIKEGVRRGCSGLPYLLCRKLLIACVIYATKAINIQRTNGQIKRGEPPPHLQLTGQRLDANMHFQYPFGTYVEATVRETNNSNDSRSEPAIYCGSLYQATANNSIYLIKTKSMALRGNMVALPMTQGMIDILDKQAIRDFGESAKDVTFKDITTPLPDEGLEEEAGEELPAPEEDGIFGAERPVAASDRRVTRSMTESAGGIEEYNVDKAAQDIRTANKTQQGAVGTPQPMVNGKEPFDSAAFWERHGVLRRVARGKQSASVRFRKRARDAYIARDARRKKARWRQLE